MATRRVLKSVVHNFLGTYLSRETDFDGYWLFGLLVSGLVSLETDLADRTPRSAVDPLDAAIVLAATKFADQVSKAGLDPWRIAKARLRITRAPGMVEGSVRGRRRDGYDVRFEVCAVADTGLRCELARSAFVAPHDPRVELRRVQAV